MSAPLNSLASLLRSRCGTITARKFHKMLLDRVAADASARGRSARPIHYDDLTDWMNGDAFVPFDDQIVQLARALPCPLPELVRLWMVDHLTRMTRINSYPTTRFRNLIDNILVPFDLDRRAPVVRVQLDCEDGLGILAVLAEEVRNLGYNVASIAHHRSVSSGALNVLLNIEAEPRETARSPNQIQATLVRRLEAENVRAIDLRVLPLLSEDATGPAPAWPVGKRPQPIHPLPPGSVVQLLAQRFHVVGKRPRASASIASAIQRITPKRVTARKVNEWIAGTRNLPFDDRLLSLLDELGSDPWEALVPFLRQFAGSGADELLEFMDVLMRPQDRTAGAPTLWVRVTGKDQRGVLARVARALRTAEYSIAEVAQHRAAAGGGLILLIQAEALASAKAGNGKLPSLELVEEGLRQSVENLKDRPDVVAYPLGRPR